MASLDKVVTITIVLLAFVVLLFIIRDVFFDFSSINPELERCAIEVRASGLLSSLTDGSRAINIDCPTQRETVPAKLSDEEQLRVLADDMLECWRVWNNGEDLLFREDAVYCHICTITDFERKTELVGLKKTLYSERPYGRETYMELLAPEISGDEFGVEHEQGVDSVDRNENYATIFFHVRGEEKIKAFNEKLVSLDGVQRPVAAGTSMYIVGKTLMKGAKTALCVTLPGFIRCVFAWTVGAAAGSIAQYVIDDEPEYASYVVLRELNDNSIAELQCQYSFAETR